MGLWYTGGPLAWRSLWHVKTMMSQVYPHFSCLAVKCFKQSSSTYLCELSVRTFFLNKILRSTAPWVKKQPKLIRHEATWRVGRSLKLWCDGHQWNIFLYGEFRIPCQICRSCSICGTPFKSINNLLCLGVSQNRHDRLATQCNPQYVSSQSAQLHSTLQLHSTGNILWTLLSGRYRYKLQKVIFPIIFTLNLFIHFIQKFSAEWNLWFTLHVFILTEILVLSCRYAKDLSLI